MRRLLTVLFAALVIAGVTGLASGPAGADAPWPWPNYRVSNDQWLAHSEPFVAQDPTNPENLVGASKMFNTLQGGANGYRFKIGTYYSHDGGKTWVDQGMLGGNDPNNAWGQQGYQNTTDPAVVFDSSGNAYVQILVYRGLGQTANTAGENKVVVYKSTDKGKTWLPPVDVYHMPPGASFVQSGDKNWLTVDTTGGRFDGFLYASWTFTEVAAQHIYFSASYDGGATWTRPHRIVSTFPARVNQTSTPVVGPDGTIYLVYHEYDSNTLYLTKSSDAGITWTVPTPVANISPPGNLNGNIRSGPLVIAVPTVLDNGTIHMVWNQLGDETDVVISTSTDGGTTWSSPRVLSAATAGDQFQPWITRTKGGDLWAMWFDRRDDPANLLVHVYAARSTDGGNTWTEYRVTDVASDPRVGLPLDRSSRGFYGDYQGLVADDQTGAQILWNETRVGSQELFFARVNPRQTTVQATANGLGTVQISGHAGFRGHTAAAAPLVGEDAIGDAPGNVAATGLDLTGAKIYQPDPYVRRLAIEFLATDLPEPRGQLPEAIRYVLSFRIGEGLAAKTFVVQAKLTNLSSITLLDEQEGHVTNAGAAFQLRGNCVGNYPQPPVPLANCPHLGWLNGHFDFTNNIVRAFLPLGASFAPEIVPGAALVPNDYAGGRIYSSPQVVVSQATVYDTVDWPDESAYPVPTKQASVGIAPAGTPEGQVLFTPVTLDGSDDFQATLPGAAGQSVYMKTCFDGRCDVTVGTVG